MHQHVVGDGGVGSVPASGTPTRMSQWCRPFRRAIRARSPSLVLLGDVGGADVGTVDRGKRRRALVQQPGAGRRRRVPAGFGADGLAAMKPPIRNGCTECVSRLVGGDHLGYRRAGRGREALRAALRAACPRGPRRAVRCAGSAPRRPDDVTASNAQVALLAPPVRMRRSATSTSPRVGSRTFVNAGASVSGGVVTVPCRT